MIGGKSLNRKQFDFEIHGRKNCNFGFKGFANYMEMEKRKRNIYKTTCF